ncbi:hypothetical protein ABLN72_02190, partial [Mycobacterium tuberculosis]
MRNSDRAKATAAYEHDDEAAPRPVEATLKRRTKNAKAFHDKCETVEVLGAACEASSISSSDNRTSF